MRCPRKQFAQEKKATKDHAKEQAAAKAEKKAEVVEKAAHEEAAVAKAAADAEMVKAKQLEEVAKVAREEAQKERTEAPRRGAARCGGDPTLGARTPLRDPHSGRVLPRTEDRLTVGKK